MMARYEAEQTEEQLRADIVQLEARLAAHETAATARAARIAELEQLGAALYAAAEREACARLAQSMVGATRREIASAIRARKAA